MLNHFEGSQKLVETFRTDIGALNSVVVSTSTKSTVNERLSLIGNTT